jgi:hypothetical protein
MSVETAIQIYVDRTYLQSIPDRLKIEIARQIGDVEVEKNKIAFCGFVLHRNEIFVFMPRGHAIHESQHTAEETARLLFLCLTKYCRTSESFLQREGKSTVVGNPQVLPLISEILSDYKLNGLYTSENYFMRKGFQGKTDWKKTIKSVHPLLDDDQIVYPHFISKFKDNLFANEITEIHKWILSSIVERFGWLIGPSAKLDFAKPNLLTNTNFNSKLIKVELQKVFADSKIHTLQMLLRFLEDDLSQGQSDYLSFGFKDFQHVWEQMLKQVLNPIHTFTDMPTPTYEDVEGRTFRKEQKGQRVDIFLYDANEKTACVIDAKYYDASSTANAPGWPDLVKQFFYAKSLTAGALNKQVEHVKNCFIFPGTENNASPKKAFVTDTTGRLDHVFPPIECLMLNPELVIDSYVNNIPLSDFRQKLLQTKHPQILN